MNFKKLLGLAAATFVSFSPVLSVMACKKPAGKNDTTLPKTLEETAYAMFKNALTKENDITGKTLFEKYKDQILGTYAINIIKEVMIRNEFAKVQNSLNNKSRNITAEDYKQSKEAFDALWDQLAMEVLYQRYLKDRVEGKFFETAVLKEGFTVAQKSDWSIYGTPKNDPENSTWDKTIQPTLEVIMAPQTSQAVSLFKTQLKSRFLEYFNHSIKPNLLDNIMRITWLKDRMFTKGDKDIYTINQNWDFARAVQTWDDNKVWNSKVKMVWEMRVKTDNVSQLPQDSDVTKIPAQELINKFNNPNNLIKTSLDPIFNMAGFRGFVAYNNAEETATYGNNSMEESYKNAVYQTNIPGLAKRNDISDYYFGNNNQFQSRVYVLPIYLSDLLQKYQVNNKPVDLNVDGLANQWRNNTEGQKTNLARNNASLADLEALQKEALINQLLYTTSQNENLVTNEQISRELYNSYVKNGSNVFDKTIWNAVSKYFNS